MKNPEINTNEGNLNQEDSLKFSDKEKIIQLDEESKNRAQIKEEISAFIDLFCSEETNSLKYHLNNLSSGLTAIRLEPGFKDEWELNNIFEKLNLFSTQIDNIADEQKINLAHITEQFLTRVKTISEIYLSRLFKSNFSNHEIVLFQKLKYQTNQLCHDFQALIFDNFKPFFELKLYISDYDEIARFLADVQNQEESALKSQELLNNLGGGLRGKLDEIFLNFESNLYSANTKKSNPGNKFVFQPAKTGSFTRLDLNNYLIQLETKFRHCINSFTDEIKILNQIWLFKTSEYFIVKQHCAEVESKIQEELVNLNQKLINDINLTMSGLRKSELPDLSVVFCIIQETQESIGKAFPLLKDKSFQLVEMLIKNTPEKSEIVKEDFFTRESFVKSDKYQVFFRKTIDDFVHRNYFSAWNKEIYLLVEKTKNYIRQILNQNNLVKLTVFKQLDNGSIIFNDHPDFLAESFLQNELESAIRKGEETEQLKKDYKSGLSGAQNYLNKNLTINYLKSEALNFKQYLPKKRFYGILNFIGKIRFRFSTVYDKIVGIFWRKQSDAIMFANKILDHNESVNSIGRILDEVEKFIPNKTVLDKIPYHYQRLFTNNEFLGNNFWYNNDLINQRIKLAYKRFNEGLGGALLVTGEPLSGKSFMARYLCAEILKSNKYYFVNGPLSGNSDSRKFEKTIQQATGLMGDLDKIFSSLETGTVVVLDDMELWWEKTEKGDKTIDELFKIIGLYSQKIFFIVTLSSQTLQVFELNNKMSHIFIDRIHCMQFNSSALQSVLLSRHQLSGLSFKLAKGYAISNKSEENSFKDKHLAKLFSKYYNFSDGNTGIALLAWLTCILDCEGSTLIMKLPEGFNYHVLDSLDKDSLLFLYHLAIHKKMDSDKVSRVFVSGKKDIANAIVFLKRCKLIVDNGGLLEMNPYLSHFILNLLKMKDMI
ncbi:MAG: hypothetical protein U0W24_05580 [Bacteroidales bacterium]